MRYKNDQYTLNIMTFNMQLTGLEFDLQMEIPNGFEESNKYYQICDKSFNNSKIQRLFCRPW